MSDTVHYERLSQPLSPTIERRSTRKSWYCACTPASVRDATRAALFFPGLQSSKANPSTADAQTAIPTMSTVSSSAGKGGTAGYGGSGDEDGSGTGSGGKLGKGGGLLGDGRIEGGDCDGGGGLPTLKRDAVGSATRHRARLY
jgi:hypothetical protein